MDYSTLAVVSNLARDTLIDSRLRRVTGLPHGEILFEFDLVHDIDSCPGFSAWVFSADLILYRAHPWLGPAPDRSEPTHLVEVASHHIGGARVADIQLAPFERVLILRFERHTYSGEQEDYRFIAELMGKHSNLILLDSSDTILASFKSVHSYQSRVREVRAGKTYQPPPRQDRIEPREFTPGEWLDFLNSAGPGTSIKDHLSSTFQGMSAIWAQDICDRAGVDPAVDIALIQSADRDKLKSAFADSLSIVSRGIPLTGESRCDFVKRLALEYSTRAEKSDFDRARASLRSVLERRKKKLKSLVDALQTDLLKSETAEEYKKKADLLVSNLYKVVQGAAEIDVENWETGVTVHLALDPHIPPQLQVEQLYQRYRKLKRTGEMSRGRLRAVQAETEELDVLAASLDSSTGLDEIRLLREQFILHGLIFPGAVTDSKTVRQGRRSRDTARPGELIELAAYRYRSNDGFLILAGKGDRSNDLLRRMSRPEDIWLHVRDIPGSHVYIVTRNREVPESTLREAAMVAAWHSKARDSSHVPVDYTRAKYVTAIPGTPGHVTFRRERTVRVTPDQDRIKAMRLLAGDFDKRDSRA